ncbi:MAG: CPBP family intramembrane metalloprotease [Ardenticatenaceae bacterium]|nr:CPBP family intramembrane metalloprotease [Anaerolineales bacterium]MCB9009505.1 CPBP family intramembrane metalloprotease [Ardenticatenaceae bacterium]
MIKKITYGVLILIFIQLLNQFLIFSGSELERTISPDFQYTRTIVGVYQQTIQAVTGIVLYRWLFKKGVKDLGINSYHKKLSMKFFAAFVLLWSAIIVLYVSATYFLFPNTWLTMKTIPLPPTNIMIATLLFQSFFPGMGEEILFRGFIISVLSAWVFAGFRQNMASKFGLIALSSAYFAIAHIYFTLAPFRLTHIDYLQIVTAVCCGAFYAIVYLKTNSLLAPFLAHNFANTSATIAGYIISGLLT